MACCGQKREAVRAPQISGAQRSTARRAAAPPPVAPARPARALAANGVAGLALSGVEGSLDRSLAVMLQYRRRSPITVRGARTGKRYEFLCGGAMQTVDAQDAEALIATGMFDRVGS